MFNGIKKFFGLCPKESVNIQSINEPIIGSYLIIDPLYPDLIDSQINYPEITNLPFVVNGYDLSKINNTDSYCVSQAINCNMTLYHSIKYFNDTCLKFQPLVQRWAQTKKLTALIRAGTDLNACYDRIFLKFYHRNNFKINKMVYTVDSSKVIAHESGHALLDCIRPDFWNVQTREGWAMHEAVGDIQAIVTISQFDVVINKALKETNGNLLLSNCISKLAEEVGMSLYPNRNPPYLRDASIVFNYQKPERILQFTIPDQLSAEPHSFSRIFSGAWYEILIKIFEKIRKNKEDLVAFKEARDICYLYLLKAIKMAPNTINLFESVAKMMLVIDKENNELYQKELVSVFQHRKIIMPKIKMLSGKTISDIKANSNKDFISLKTTDNFHYAHVLKKRTIKLSDHLILAQSENHPIFNAEIEIANDSFYIFDKNENLIDEMVESEDDIITEANQCVNSILEKNMLDKFWKINNDKLIRVCVDCGLN